ncbi:MAG: Gfo/Idh/MocA family oxidoreductase [Blautia sp.]|nr:Gfo/Idh/MocA family oxidoreductase [Blautia sp.]
MKEIITAVIGAGFIGAVHIETIRRLGKVRIVALCDANGAEEKAAQFGIEQVFTDYREMIDSCDLDAVHICTPNFTHYEIAKYAIGHGVNFICEKPFTTTVEQAEELIALANEKGVKGAVNFHNRLYPVTNEMRQMISGGELGEIFTVHGEYIQDWLLYETDYSWRLDKSQVGKTRAIADIGSHWMDLAEFVSCMRIKRVNAKFRTVYPVRKKPTGEVLTFASAGADQEYEEIPIDTEDEAVVLFEFENGALGTMLVSMVYAGRKNTTTLAVSGSKKALKWDSEDLNNLWIGYREKANEVLTKDASLLHPLAARLGSYPSGHIEGFADAFKNVFRQFYGSLTDPDGVYEYATLEDGLREMKLCDAVFESAKSETWVEV